jgi:SAM-dependent methyltransferase
MLRFARRRLEDAGVRARVARGRMESFSFARPFDIAHCLVSTFRYLLDEASAAAHLACVADALRPGGVYVLGLHVCDYDQAGCARERWTADRDGVGVVCNIQSWPPDRRTRMERVRSRLVVDRGGRVERFETHWTFRTYSVRQLRALIRSEPRLEHVATYDFGYDVDRPVELDGSCIDYVLVLRRAG